MRAPPLQTVYHGLSKGIPGQGYGINEFTAATASNLAAELPMGYSALGNKQLAIAAVSEMPLCQSVIPMTLKMTPIGGRMTLIGPRK